MPTKSKLYNWLIDLNDNDLQEVVEITDIYLPYYENNAKVMKIRRYSYKVFSNCSIWIFRSLKIMYKVD